MAGNLVVEADSAQSVVAIVLWGSQTPRTRATPAQLSMPSLGWRLSESEVAEVVTFVRSSWGNRASGVAAGDVRDVPAGLEKPTDSAPRNRLSLQLQR